MPSIMIPPLFPLLIGIKRKLKKRSTSTGNTQPGQNAVAADSSRGVCISCKVNSGISMKLDSSDDGKPALFCPVCHPYTDLENTSIVGNLKSSRVGDKSILARIPSLSAQDTNHLMRAIGMALSDPERKQNAEAILLHLRERSKDVAGTWNTRLVSDFGAAMRMLTDEEYFWRKDAVADLRIIFNDDMLARLGKSWTAENPELPVKNWLEKVKNLVGKPA